MNKIEEKLKMVEETAGNDNDILETLRHIRATQDEVTSVVKDVFLNPNEVIWLTEQLTDKSVNADAETIDKLIDEYNSITLLLPTKPQYSAFSLREQILKVYVRMLYYLKTDLDDIIKHGSLPDAVLDHWIDFKWCSGYYFELPHNGDTHEKI